MGLCPQCLLSMALEDEEAATGYKLEPGPFPGWGASRSGNRRAPFTRSTMRRSSYYNGSMPR
jgi:hypothetical protein